MKRNPESLTAADLPRVDPARFDEWKSLNRRARMAPLLGLLVWASTIITVPLIGGAIGWALPIVFWFTYMFAYVAPLASKERTLAAELGVPAALGLTSADVAREERVRKVAKTVGLVMVGVMVLSIVVTLILSGGNRRAGGVSAVATTTAQSFAAVLGDRPAEVQATWTPPRFFEAAGVTPQAGRFFVADDHAAGASVVVISHALWQDQYKGDLGVLGRVIQFNGRDHTVVGIAPPGFTSPNMTELWTPIATR